MKSAVITLLASIVTMQESVPLHAPLQPLKVELRLAEAVTVTTVPSV